MSFPAGEPTIEEPGSASNAGPSALARLARRAWVVPVLLAGIHLALALLAFNPTPYAGGDNGAYLALARSLLERGDYVELWDPALRPHTQYPPAFPAVLALALLAGLKPWVGLKLVVVGFSAAAVAFSYLWIRRTAGAGVALGAAGLLAVAPGIVAQSHWVLSDVPFWAFTTLALWGFAALERRGPADGTAPGRAAWKWLALAAAGATLAYLTRSAGLPLVVAAVAWLALRRRWRELAVFAAVFALPAFLWWLYARGGDASGYLHYVRMWDPYNPAAGTVGAGDLIDRVGGNLTRYLTRHLPILLFGQRVGGWMLGGGVAVAALAGWALRMRRPGVAELWLPLYVGLLLIWPAAWSGERLLLPMLPALLLYAGTVLRELAAGAGRPRLVGALVAVLLAVAMLPGLDAQVRYGRACSRTYRAGERFPCQRVVWGDFFRLADRARGRLPAGSVVISRKPTLWWAHSGYRSRMYPLSTSPDTFFRAAVEAGAAYVVLDRSPDLAPLYLRPVVRARGHALCVIPTLSLPRASLAWIDHAGRGCPPETVPAAVAPDD